MKIGILGTGHVARLLASAWANAGHQITLGSRDPGAKRLDFSVKTLADTVRWADVVVNATPLGMKEDDPLPFDIARISPHTFVGEVVMKSEYTPFLCAAREKGCEVQVGTDMLFEMIPAYLEFFGFGTATPDELRSAATIAY